MSLVFILLSFLVLVNENQVPSNSINRQLVRKGFASECFSIWMFLVLFLEKQPTMPILKNEIKCLPPLPPLSKSSTVLHTFNSTILTPVSNNNSGFLRNLLNSSTGKVRVSFIVYAPP